METLHYKGFNGSVQFSSADGCYWGRITGIDDIISYEGNTREEFEADFKNAVDDYLGDLAEAKAVATA